MPEITCIREKPWDIQCRVIKQDGTCAIGHNIGDEVVFTSVSINGKICIHALYSMMPKVVAMMHNAIFPWLEDQCKVTHACPDGFNPVIFELKRIEPE